MNLSRARYIEEDSDEALKISTRKGNKGYNSKGGGGGRVRAGEIKGIKVEIEEILINKRDNRYYYPSLSTIATSRTEGILELYVRI